MARALVVSLAAAAGWLHSAQADAPVGQDLCMERWRCAFEHINSTTGQTWRWDLSTLCKPYSTYYVDNAQSSYQNFTFNVCGNTSRVCSDFRNTKPQYESHGVAIQYMQDADGVRKNAAYSCMREDNVTACPDWTYGGTTCCSVNRCEVAALEAFTFDVVDQSNPGTGGVKLIHTGYPSTPNDQIPCPAQASGLIELRQFILTLQCDPKGRLDDMTIVSYDESYPYCTFRVTAKTKAACGLLDVPQSSNTAASTAGMVGPGGQFGYTILGALLVLGMQVAVPFALAKYGPQYGVDPSAWTMSAIGERIMTRLGLAKSATEKVPLRFSATGYNYQGGEGASSSPNRFSSSTSSTSTDL